MKHSLQLSGIGVIPISVVEADAGTLHISGRQAIALLRTLEQHRTALEQQAQAERDQEFGRGPGAFAGDVPHKTTRGDARLGKPAISQTNNYGRVIAGTVTAILHYSNGVEQLEITWAVYAPDSCKPGKAKAWVHADDVDINNG